LWLADDALWLTVLQPAAQPALDGDHFQPGRRPLIPDLPDLGVHLRLSFVGANPAAALVPFDPLTTTISYFKGSDPDQWRPAVPVWGGVRYANLYPGLDLELTAAASPRLVCRAADCPAALAAVRLRVEGADSIALAEDGVRVATAAGDVTLPLFEVVDGDGRPVDLTVVRPEVKGTVVSVPVAAGLTNEFYSGDLAPDDPSDLIYSTFLGGSFSDWATGLALDSAGNALLVGGAYSADFPVTAGVFDPSFEGICEAFVSMFNTSASTLMFSTFLGGADADFGYGVALDASGSIYLTGETASADFPTTSGAIDPSYNGDWDVFVAKLNSSGSVLQYGTYLGGADRDFGAQIAVDDTGAVLVTGNTSSPFFPTTPGAFDPSFNGSIDAFVAKLNPTGTDLVFGTFLGDAEADYANDLLIDGNGDVFLAGVTTSPAFPTTAGAYDPSFNGSYDAFLARLSADGSALPYSTFLGGTQEDEGTGLALDASGRITLVGSTNSNDFPTTPGAFDTDYGGNLDIYVTRFELGGSALVFSTFLGGSAAESGERVTTDSNGRAYVIGDSDGSGFPTTPGALSTDFLGITDAVVAILSPDGSSLRYGTYIGGWEEEIGTGIVVDQNGDVVAVGGASSTDFPITAGAYDPSYNGNGDAFVLRLRPEPAVAPTTVSLTGPAAGFVDMTYPFTATAAGPISLTLPLSYFWEATDQQPLTHTAGLTDTAAFHWSTGGPKTITVTALNEAGFVTATHTITVYEPVTAAFSAAPLTGTAPLTVTFANLSTGDFDACAWTFGDGGSSDLCTDPAYPYADPGTYTVTLSVSGPGGTDTLTETDLHHRLRTGHGRLLRRPAHRHGPADRHLRQPLHRRLRRLHLDLRRWRHQQHLRRPGLPVRRSGRLHRHPGRQRPRRHGHLTQTDYHHSLRTGHGRLLRRAPHRYRPADRDFRQPLHRRLRRLRLDLRRRRDQRPMRRPDPPVRQSGQLHRYPGRQRPRRH
jgi:hypothetical protein